MRRQQRAGRLWREHHLITRPSGASWRHLCSRALHLALFHFHLKKVLPSGRTCYGEAGYLHMRGYLLEALVLTDWYSCCCGMNGCSILRAIIVNCSSIVSF